LRAVGQLPDWRCDKRPNEPEKLFLQLPKELPKQDENVKGVVDHLQKKKQEKIDSGQWSAVCKSVSEKLASFDIAADPTAGEAIYVSIQQVSSVLRSTSHR
jgi:hypothetical protein